MSAQASDDSPPLPVSKDGGKKKKRSAAELQRELRDLSQPDPTKTTAQNFDVKKLVLRIGLIALMVWGLGIALASFTKSSIPIWIVSALTVAAAGAGIWFYLYVQKSRKLGAILQGATGTEAGRKEALQKLESEFKKGDVQATMARAQLEMQDDPHKALATLEGVPLDKQMVAVADQVRSMRAMIHLTLGQTAEARNLVDAMTMGKQEEVKTRAMFAAVAGETWGRTGQAKKAVELLEVFNPEDPELAEMRIQMWRARAFAYAGNNDMKGVGRALRKLAEVNPQLLGMFVTGKKVHPLLQKEAKDLFMKSGYVPRKMVQRRM